MLVDDVRTRIEDQIADLAGRTKTAADLSELVRQKALRNAPSAAYVLPLGLRARNEGDASAGAFTQMLDETVGVLLVLRNQGDVTGRRALPEIDALVAALMAAIAGWAPGGEAGVFRVARGQLLSAEAGAVMYQLDFSILTQLRNL